MASSCELPDPLLAVGDQGEVDPSYRRGVGLSISAIAPSSLAGDRTLRRVRVADDPDVGRPCIGAGDHTAPVSRTSGPPTRVRAMRLHVVDHPLVAHKLTTCATRSTDSPTFRRLADELVTLLAYEATRDVRVEHGRRSPRRSPRPPACRLAQPAAARRPDPAGRARHARRDDAAAADGGGRLPRDGAQRGDARRPRRTPSGCPTTCPAASATCSTRCSRPAARWPRRSSSSSTAAPTTSRRSACSPRPRAARASRRSSRGSTSRSPWSPPRMDERLNEKGYIVPGLGDAGDRLYGLAG